MADMTGISPLDHVRMMLGMQTDAEQQMLARRSTEAGRVGDDLARARGDVPPVVRAAPVTTPIKSSMDRTTAGVLQQRQETMDSVMKDFQNLYGPKPVGQ